MTQEDERWMRRAIEIARSKGSHPSTAPLGSVIVLDGREIAREIYPHLEDIRRRSA